MGDVKGFLKVKKCAGEYRAVCERIKDFNDILIPRTDEQSKQQASRCMDCGVPFCHWGCPVGNVIPEWNDEAFHGHWEHALKLLTTTNNLPEITGRICPASCEYACVLGINDDPVTIRENELAIIEYGFSHGLIKPKPPSLRTNKKIAIIGSGPAGLACADQLNKLGHTVTVFERDEAVGGILRYGIPDFKLEKKILDRRITLYESEGIMFKTSVNVGIDMPGKKLLEEFDAVCLAGGSRVPRDLNIEGRELNGIHYAMDYLSQSNKKVCGSIRDPKNCIDAQGKKVVVIGGGDTGADCVGTAHRQGALCVTQIELLPKPAEYRTSAMPWPLYPLLLKTTSSHAEGGERLWAVSTKKFIGEHGQVKKLLCNKMDFSLRDEKGCPILQEIPGSEFEIETDLVILAMGFLHPEKTGLLAELGVEFDGRGNVKTSPQYMTNVDKVFAAGDMRRGQSLVVWAIYEGRSAASEIHSFLG